MKIYLLVILTVVFSCKSKLEHDQIKGYSIKSKETLKEYHYYLMLESNIIDSFNIEKHVANNFSSKNSIDVIQDCISKNINVNEKFLRFVVNKEGISVSDTSIILSYLHSLTKYTLIVNTDLSWNKNYHTFKQNILTRLNNTKSEEFEMYKNVFVEIENNLHNNIYLFDKSNLTSTNFYSPIYKLTLSKNKGIDYKEITCDFGKMRNPYE